jgi:hypothetical protein
MDARTVACVADSAVIASFTTRYRTVRCKWCELRYVVVSSAPCRQLQAAVARDVMGAADAVWDAAVKAAAQDVTPPKTAAALWGLTLVVARSEDGGGVVTAARVDVSGTGEEPTALAWPPQPATASVQAALPPSSPHLGMSARLGQ